MRNTNNDKVNTPHSSLIPDIFTNAASQVEGEVQGNSESVVAFLKDVDNGPKGSHVVKLEKEQRDLVEGESAFEVRS